MFGVTLPALAVLCVWSGCQKETPPPAATPTPVVATPPVAAGETAAPTAGAPTAEEILLWADANPDWGPAPLKVNLSVEPLEDVSDVQWTWDFGDGSPESHEQNPTHTYARPGQYTARVRISDTDGNWGEDEAKIDVEEPVPE